MNNEQIAMPACNLTYRPITRNLAEIHSFSAKERDAETGLRVTSLRSVSSSSLNQTRTSSVWYSLVRRFGARYYSSDLSIWLSVDPMSDKYPSFSPYTYCANNPVKCVDPNGEKVFAVNEKTKEYIAKYMEDQFGTVDFYTYSNKNELKIDSKKYRNTYKSANNYQQVLLKGLKKACGNSSSAFVEIDDKKEFNYTVYVPVFNKDDEIDHFYPVDGRNFVESGVTQDKGVGGDCLIFINNKGSESTTMSSKDGTTGECASAVFFHELLDEFYNYFVKGKTKDSSSKFEKVYYQNNALQNKGLFPRDGEDHQ